MKKFFSSVPVILIGGALLLGAAYFAFQNISGPEQREIKVEEGTTENGINPSDLEVGESTQNGGYTVERLPDAPQEGITAPDLTRAIPSESVNMDHTAYVQIIRNMEATLLALKDSPDSFNAWMNLSSYRTILGDYDGSEEVLVFLTQRFSPTWQVHANLGSLYSIYLNDPNKAINSYMKAIDILPNNPALYRSLYEVYAQQNNSDQAIAILKRGIENQPTAIDLYVLLARYVGDQGQKEDAVLYYNEAIKQAELVNNSTLKTDLETERDML